LENASALFLIALLVSNPSASVFVAKKLDGSKPPSLFAFQMFPKLTALPYAVAFVLPPVIEGGAKLRPLGDAENVEAISFN
jgi:hypothetical protein